MKDNPDKPNANVIRSAGFTVYPELGQIKIGGETFSLGPVNMRVLLVLLRSEGEIVSRSQFYEQVWSNQIVSDDALTRCISDLRIQLGQHNSEVKLIETLPKRGYRWRVEVKEGEEETFQKESAVWKQYLVWGLLSFVLLIVLSTSLLWFLINQQNKRFIQIAVLPVSVNNVNQGNIAIELEDLLKEELLSTRQLRFLAPSVLDNHLQNPYPYLYRELGAQWIIEGTIRQQDNSVRISLNLVDARTALVSYTKRADINKQEADLAKLSVEFIREVSDLLQKDK